MANMMKYILLTAVCLLSVVATYAQPILGATTEVKLEIANEQLDKKDYYRAVEWYEKYYEATDNKDKTVLYPWAMALMNNRDYIKAEKKFDQLLETKKINLADYPEARFHHARMMKMNGKYDEAIAGFEEFLKTATDARLRALAQSEIEGVKLARTLKPVDGVKIDNAGDKINTKSLDCSPTQAENGDLYFTALRNEEIIILDGKQSNSSFTQVYKVKKSGKSGWGEAKALETDVNRPDVHHGNVYVTPDANWLYFTRNELTGNAPTSSTLFMSKKQGSGWAPAQEVKGINGAYMVKNPAIGDLFGKEVLYFSSNMEGGKGGFDLYYATKNADGTYAKPTNLGDVINTPGDDETPFYRDGKLYFSSTGHPGIGGADIFMSAWNGSTWSKPTNMGMGYNSPADDHYFSMSADGYHGWFVSNREGTRSMHSKTCCDDIWEVNIEKPTVNIEALVTNGKEPIKGATMQLVEMTDNKFGTTDSKSNATANNFGWPLDFNKSYALITTKDKYFPDTTYFNTTDLGMKTTTVKKTVTLKPVPPPPGEITIVDTTVIVQGEPIRLDKIYYDYAKWDILPDAAVELDYLDTLMRQYPDMVIELSSHTDARGSDTYNQELSQKRAESARNYLLARGVASERIKAVGYGETQILNQCTNGVECSDDEHRYNRRTEAKIISGPTEIKITRKEFSTRKVKANSGEKGKVIEKVEQAPAPKQEMTPKSGGQTAATTTPAPAKVTAKGKPAMSFDGAKVVEFGNVKRGEKKEHVYNFTNTGDKPLNIDIVSGCDCTTLTWTETTVPPGGKGFIKAIYDSGKAETDELDRPLKKDITVVLKENDTVSGYPIVEEVSFKVFVKK